MAFHALRSRGQPKYSEQLQKEIIEARSEVQGSAALLGGSSVALGRVRSMVAIPITLLRVLMNPT